MKNTSNEKRKGILALLGKKNSKPNEGSSLPDIPELPEASTHYDDYKNMTNPKIETKTQTREEAMEHIESESILFHTDIETEADVFPFSVPSIKKAGGTESTISGGTERKLNYTASFTNTKRLGKITDIKHLYLDRNPPPRKDSGLPPTPPRKDSGIPPSFSQFSRSQRTDTMDSNKNPYYFGSLSRKDSELQIATINSAPSNLLSRQVSIDEAIANNGLKDLPPPSRKPPEIPDGEDQSEDFSPSPPDVSVMESDLEQKVNVLLNDIHRIDPQGLSNSIKNHDANKNETPVALNEGKEEEGTLPGPQVAAPESSLTPPSNSKPPAVMIVSAPDKDFKSDLLINIYTCWYDNSNFFRENVVLYKQRLKLEAVRELNSLLGHLQNGQVEDLGEVNKINISLNGKKTRSLNWLMLLNEIRLIINLFECTTRTYFAQTLPKVFISMNQWLSRRELANVVSGINPHEINQMLTSFFALFANAAGEADKILFLKQAMDDLTQIEAELAGTGLFRQQFKHIKYLTIGSFKENSRNRKDYLPEAYVSEFTDILTLLRGLDLPALESVIIEDFIDNRVKTNFVVLIRFLQKNSENLKTVVLGQCFSEEDRELIKIRLQETDSDNGRSGRDLHLMSELPKSLAEYKRSYIFIRKNDTHELYYIKPDGKSEKAKIVDFNLFEEKINTIKNRDENKLHLSDEQIKEIVTSNGGHTPSTVKIAVQLDVSKKKTGFFKRGAAQQDLSPATSVLNVLK